MGLTIDELQTRVERLQAIADNLPAIIAYWDRDERCQFSNRACMDWFGLDPAQLGLPMREVLGANLYAQNQPYVDGVLRGEPQFFERTLVDRLGVLRATQTSYIPDIQNGSVQGFFVLISEISAIKRAEAAAMESRAQLQALLDAVPDYILSLDRGGRILFANRTMARPVESLIGNAVQDYFPDEHKELARRAIEAAFEDGQPSAFETVAALGDTKRFFACQIIPVLRDGKTTSALMLSRDVTERKHMEMQLIAAERLAAVGALAAGVAHEINTPVQFVRDSVVFLREAYAELMGVLEKLLALHASAEDPQRRRQLVDDARACIEDADLDYLRNNVPQAIERSIGGLKRVAEIVRSLKAFSHLDHKEMEETQLDQLVDSSLTLAVHEYKYVAEIVRDYADVPTVRCHIGSLSQVILNLVVNAAHAIAEKAAADKPQLGRITIGLRDQGETVLISISDTGVGIPEQIRSRIFAPFFTTKAVGKGTGQGLAISWNIVVQEHRGQIWFESEVGVGTTFYIRIPKDPDKSRTDTANRLAS